MTTMEWISLVTALLSIILAVLSMVLSILFYRWSETSNKEMQRLSTDIGSNVKKIEAIFDKLYSDTFGMMKSNMEVMQSRFLASGDSNLSVDEQIEEAIISCIVKTKNTTSESLCYIIKAQLKDKKLEDNSINDSIQKLITKGTIFKQGDIICIAGRNPDILSNEQS